MIIGEAWGREEEEAGGKPFVGYSGKLLNNGLKKAGLRRSDAYITNVFNLRPRPSNAIENLCGPKDMGVKGWPHLRQGKYIRQEFQSELDRLLREIREVNPTLILALGNTPTWALLKMSGIKKLRGAPWYHQQGEKRWKVLPTYHPAGIMRDWSLMPVWLMDLEKAAREMYSREIVRPHREIWVEPTLDDLYQFETQFIDKSTHLSIDSETVGDQITCIGFSPSIDRAIVVPFFDPRKADNNYWPSIEEELNAWRWVRKQCMKKKTVVGQNFLYDLSFLWRSYGITVPSVFNLNQEDTMLLHHALYPELDKGLGFLGSIYTDEAAWKFNRHTETIKTEE
jgi:DNA polymerase